MRMNTAVPSSRPYHVRTTSGALHSGYENEQAAAEAVHRVNAQAERLGIATRYVVKERDA